MPYAIAVMRALVQEHGVAVDCIYWDHKKRTPFVPVNEKGITFHKRSLFDERLIKHFIEERSPSIIYVVGRMDDLYLKACLSFRGNSTIVTGSDNQWHGDLKQRIAALFNPLLYKRYFEYFWVPGKRQYEFAQRMGYSADKIIRNLLTADTAVFGTVFEDNRQSKRTKYPHTIVYAGRFAQVKGLDLLIQAFRNAKNETQNDWRLILVGAGDMKVSSDSFTEVKGYMTGAELAAESRNWGVFCLPSVYEPWGVVIHEFTMAGLPVICSDKVGAADDLVTAGGNGFVFKSEDINELKKAILNIMAKSDAELFAMGERSHELSKKFSPSIAADSLLRVLK